MNAELALIVSLLSIVVALLTWTSQRKHNWLSVRPLAAITCNDLNELVVVTLRNNGTGPLIIRSLRVKNDEGNERDSLYAWVPRLPVNERDLWFVGEVDRRSIRPGGSITLLRYRHPSEHLRDQLRAALARLTVVVEFEDIYERRQDPYTRTLNWFGRTEPLKG